MKRTTVYLASIILLILVNLGSLAFIWYHRPGGGSHMHRDISAEFLTKELELSGPQKDEYFRLRKSHRESMKRLTEYDRILHHRFFDMLLPEILDTARMNMVADSIAINRKQMEMVTCRHFYSIKKMLTLEQKKKFGIIFNEILQHVLPPPPPPPPGSPHLPEP